MQGTGGISGKVYQMVKKVEISKDKVYIQGFEELEKELMKLKALTEEISALTEKISKISLYFVINQD